MTGAVAATPAETGTRARGAPGRVAAVHHDARRTVLLAAAFVVAAAVAAAMPHHTGTWLPLHLFLVGGLLLAISGVTQMLAVTWSAAPAPRHRLAAAQRTTVAVGAVGIALGRELDAPAWALGLAGVLVSLGLVLLGGLLVAVRRGAVVHRFDAAIDGHLTAVACGVAGTVMGALLASGHPGAHAGEVRTVHVLVNLLGLVGVVIAATVPYFTATVARTKVAARATPGAVRMAVAHLTVATVLAAIGAVIDRPHLLAAGLAVYAVGVVGLLRLLPRLGRLQLEWAGPRVLQLVAGVVWWAAAVARWAVDAWSGSVTPSRALVLLVVGGYAQVLAGSLAYLGPVLRGGGHERLSAGFATTRSWWSLVAGNAAAVAALTGQQTLLGVLLVLWAGDVAWRLERLLLAQKRTSPR